MGQAKLRRLRGPGPACFRYPRADGDALVAAGVPTLLRDATPWREPGAGFDPLRHRPPPDLPGFLAQRYPSAPPNARWRICGGFLLHVQDAGDGVSGATLAFRLPAEPYYALLTVVTRQSPSELAALRAATSTDGLTATGAFLPEEDGPPTLLGGLTAFEDAHAGPQAGTLTLLLPDWDANSLTRILRPFGIEVRLD